MNVLNAAINCPDEVGKAKTHHPISGSESSDKFHLFSLLVTLIFLLSFTYVSFSNGLSSEEPRYHDSNFARFEVSVSRILFGMVPLKAQEQRSFKIRNTNYFGNLDTLEIANIVASDSAFTVQPHSGKIARGDSLQVTVSFVPTSAKIYVDTLKITFSDSLLPEVNISLEGKGSPIVFTTPSFNALHVAVHPIISCRFIFDINPASLSDGTIAVTGSESGLCTESSLTYDSQTKTVSIDPGLEFRSGEVVTVLFTRAVLTAHGDSLPFPVAWKFRIRTLSGTGSFSTNSSLATVDDPWGICSADFDADGYLDLAVAHFFAYRVTIIKNKKNGTFGDTSDYQVGDEPHDIICGDWNGDGKTDIATANRRALGVTILMNVGEAGFAREDVHVAGDTRFGNGPIGIESGDWNGDGAPDLATISADTAAILMNDSSGRFRVTTTLSLGVTPYSIVGGDWDKDGDIDLAIAGEYGYLQGGRLLTWSNLGDGHFAKSSELRLDIHYPSEPLCEDWDIDGDLDIGMVSFYSGSIVILDNNGYGAFALKSVYQTPQLASFASGDIDANGTIDFLTSGRFLRIFRNGGGIFSEEPPLEDVGTTSRIVLGDWNNDGALDIAATSRQNNMVFIWENSPTTSISDSRYAARERYQLFQNFPNPFNPTTTISYALPRATHVSLKIFNLLAKEVATVVDAHQDAGFHEIRYDAATLASGIYFYRLQTNQFTATKKFVVTK